MVTNIKIHFPHNLDLVTEVLVDLLISRLGSTSNFPFLWATTSIMI